MAIEVNQTLRIGIDIGGTFTDFVVLFSDSGEFETFKLLSTPDDPSRAVIQGIEIIQGQYPDTIQRLSVIHGSTVATNALIEHKGAATALITTNGFRDILEIGRQNRSELYIFATERVPPLVPREYRIGIQERIDHTGQILISLQENEIEKLVSSLSDSPIESIAVCLLFSFINPIHEQAIAQHLRRAGFFVSPSSEILPEFREYERTSTTVINAYVSPVLDRYLTRLDVELKKRSNEVHLQVMQSNGGNISVAEARRGGVHCILSGPAGGIIGADTIFKQSANILSQGNFNPNLPELKVITFDMGGTSTDVSLIDGTPIITNEAIVSGYPIRIPVLDIHTIGAGGGSIASIDAGGALRVGPKSAGANPGPACYGRVTPDLDRPTVTDANLVLGRLAKDHFLGGRMPLYPDRARNVLQDLGERIQLDPVNTALGIIQVVNAHMVRALRLISVERGHDPQDFTLVSFGGAGGLHASALARELGIPRVLIPPNASTLSAFGMLAANVIKDYSRTVMLDGESSKSRIDQFLDALTKRGLTDLSIEGFSPNRIVLRPALDMRYRGQSYELIVPYEQDFQESFHEMHRKNFGYARPDTPIEIVNVRLRAIGLIPPIQIQMGVNQGSDPQRAFIEKGEVFLSETPKQLPLFNGERLAPGNQFLGPAIVLRSDTTILVDEGDFAEVDEFGNLLLTIEDKEWL